MKKLAIFAMAVLLGGCAAPTVRKDPYAQAAMEKRTEIARLDRLIDSLRAHPEVADVAAKLDSLEKRRAIEQANVTGIGAATGSSQEADPTATFFGEAAKNEAQKVEQDNRKYPIKKP